MKILAVDTSSKAASCALWEDDVLKAEFFGNLGLTHSQTILPMIESLLEACGLRPADIDRFAVSAGPGSFTGLRIGMSAVKGLAMAAGKPCAAVSTLESLAQNVACFPGLIVPVMDARRNQVYTALFSAGTGQLRRLSEDEALSLVELGERLREKEQPVLLCGDGAALCFDALATSVPGIALAPEALRHQRAGSVAVLAARQNAVDPAELQPNYLRLPQAQRELLRKGNAQA